MYFIVKSSRPCGSVQVPGSKSHTIRALITGALARGESIVRMPLDSSDTQSCIKFVRALGAEVDDSSPEIWKLQGPCGKTGQAHSPIDVGNSGTTLFLGMAVAAAGPETVEITGDSQTRRRDAGPLLKALSDLGAKAYSPGGCGKAPFVVGGGLKGGLTSIECPTSQYLSALLIACPLASGNSTISVPVLHEKPYVEMTLKWLGDLGISCDYEPDYSRFEIPGRQRYRNFDVDIAADFSSAAFFLLAAAVSGTTMQLNGLDITDTQGDKEAVWMFEKMGCNIEISGKSITISGPDRLSGAVFDLNATPDLLPVMAVAGTLAEGETKLLNVPQARIKETDRIEVMAHELAKMGAKIKELDDGLIIKGGGLKGTGLCGHGDHRVVMALSVAAMAARGCSSIDTAEAVEITFPDFEELMRKTGADIRSSGSL